MKSAEVQILIAGKPVKQHWHENNWYVEARKGTNYEVKVKNNGHKRILAVVSIDGLSVLDGKPATSDSQGYIIDAYASYSVKGFRVSNEEVNLFEFADKSQSYAVKSPTGEESSANCGVIAVRVFSEKEVEYKSLEDYLKPRPPFQPEPVPYYPYRDPIWAISNADMDMVKCQSLVDEDGPVAATSSWDSMETVRSPLRATMSLSENQSRRITAKSAPSKGFDMGTKFSEEKTVDKVTEVSFERGDLLHDISIFYASRASLEEFGIKFAPEPKVSALPSGFKDKYCQPPK